MTPITLGKFLMGSREAIEQIARTPYAIFVGLLFVLSAGLAREYDGEDLLHEPWHLLLPLGASLATGTLLYLLVAGVGWLRGAGVQPFFERYRVLLSLYWMTAPLAWIYAVPVERFLSPSEATRANLWMLGVVALWRVLLITRVVSVLYRTRYTAALFVVMLMADVVTFSVMTLIPRPVIGLMGGIRLTESESIIANTTFQVMLFTILLFPVWLVGAIAIAIPWGKKRGWSWLIANDVPTMQVHWSAWSLAAATLVFGFALLPLTQPEQQRRRFVESSMRQGRIEEALAYMNERDRDDFPPHWDPPPRWGYGERKPGMWTVLRLLDDDGAAWVREMYVEKLVLRASGWGYYADPVVDIKNLDDDDLQRYVEFVASLPESQAVARHHSSQVEDALYEYLDGENVERSDLSEARRSALKQLESLEAEDQGRHPPS